MIVRKKIQDHLKESDMSYGYHLRHSIKQSNRLIKIAVKSYIHGLLPWVYINSGPLGVFKIYKEIRNLQHVQKLIKRDAQNKCHPDNLP